MQGVWMGGGWNVEPWDQPGTKDTDIHSRHTFNPAIRAEKCTPTWHIPDSWKPEIPQLLTIRSLHLEVTNDCKCGSSTPDRPQGWLYSIQNSEEIDSRTGHIVNAQYLGHLTTSFMNCPSFVFKMYVQEIFIGSLWCIHSFHTHWLKYCLLAGLMASSMNVVEQVRKTHSISQEYRTF